MKTKNVFMYTNEENTKNKLLTMGFKLLNCQNGMYVFANNPAISYEKHDLGKVYFSDILNY